MFLLGALVVHIFCTSAVRAQEVLTESDVVRLAMARAPDSTVADARSGLADARERTAGLLPNPWLAWERETLGQSNVQNILRLTVPIRLAGPLTTRSLTASRSAWTRAEASARRATAVLEALMRYYDVAAARRRVAILEQAEASLEEGARVLAERQAAGAASGYESARLAVARELAASRTAQARSTLRGARARLAGWLDLDPETVRVDAELDLSEGPGARHPPDLARRSVTERETAKHARQAVRAAEEAEDRAAWTWAPTLRANGGWNGVQSPGLQNGYVLGIAVSLPLFDRGQDLRAQATAERALARARARAVERSIRTEVAVQLAAYRAAREELARFERSTAEPVKVVVQAARAGYREGEHTLGRLLDAQRTRTEVALQRLELRVDAKRAEARLRAASGELR